MGDGLMGEAPVDYIAKKKFPPAPCCTTDERPGRLPRAWFWRVTHGVSDDAIHMLISGPQDRRTEEEANSMSPVRTDQRRWWLWWAVTLPPLPQRCHFKQMTSIPKTRLLSLCDCHAAAPGLGIVLGSGIRDWGKDDGASISEPFPVKPVNASTAKHSS